VLGPDGNWIVGDLPGGTQAYRSMQVWDKIKIGLGYWFRDRHEFILVGVRGNPVPPAQGTQDHSLFSEAKGEHSAKPDRVAEMVERLWPNIWKIEMFARKPRDPSKRWKTWGLEAPQPIEAERGADASESQAPEDDASTQPATGDVTRVTESASLEPAPEALNAESAGSSSFDRGEERPENTLSDSSNLLPKSESIQEPKPVDPNDPDDTGIPIMFRRTASVPVASQSPREAQFGQSAGERG
jgi:hypothetical protein